MARSTRISATASSRSYFDPRRNRNTSSTGRTRLNGRTGSSSPRNRPRRLAAGSLHKQEMNGKPGRCLLPKIPPQGAAVAQIGPTRAKTPFRGRGADRIVYRRSRG